MFDSVLFAITTEEVENEYENGNILLGWCVCVRYVYAPHDLVGNGLHFRTSGDLRQWKITLTTQPKHYQ